jgi:hypothetical protein
VNDTNSDTSTAKATVIPKEEETPHDALHEGHGDEHRDDRQGRGHHREADSAKFLRAAVQ